MTDEMENLTNGRPAAAILSAAVGCATLGLLQCGSEVSRTLARALLFSPASGALSGETSLAICTWLLIWFVLAQRWKLVTLNMKKINYTSACLIVVGAALTFPPIDDAIARMFGKSL